MNDGYREILSATAYERRDLFLGAAANLGTAVQYIEKDFWVCWTLDVLFNGLAKPPRLLFKGGTSLSKAFGLISRFSEDIDITVFRDDLGHPLDADDLTALSGKKRRQELEAVRQAAQEYIQGPMIRQLEEHAGSRLTEWQYRFEIDASDPDRQTILFWYPAVTPPSGEYIRSAVKIEGGARSALDPHVHATVKPYVAALLPHIDLSVANVTTVKPERTFWDKVVIAHGLKQWYERRGELKYGGQRVSRHYYDLYTLLLGNEAAEWPHLERLADDCATHAKLFFGGTDYGLDLAKKGGYTLVPQGAMRDALAKDYEAMSGMIFGDVPAFDEVVATIEGLEARINGG